MSARSVAVVGPESTGKTTLAHRLAARFAVPISLEYARIYAEACHPQTLTAADVRPIAEGEEALLDEAEARAGHLWVRDTDLLSTLVWARLLYPGEAWDWLLVRALEKPADLYLLAAADTPYVIDPVRGPAGTRERDYRAFEAALAELGRPVVRLAGPWEARDQLAEEAVSKLISAPR